MRVIAVIFLFLAFGMLHATPTVADEFKKREAQMAQYKNWLDTLGPSGSKYWIRIDAKHRPHRLYLGDGFYRADFKSQERFVDTYSNYLSGLNSIGQQFHEAGGDDRVKNQILTLLQRAPKNGGGRTHL